MKTLVKVAGFRIHHGVPRTRGLLHSRFESYLSSNIESGISTNSEEYKSNFKRNTRMADELREMVNRNKLKPQSRAIERHLKSRKFSVDQRISKLLDEGSAFLELSQLAGFKLYQKDIADAKNYYEYEDCHRGGIVTGIGTVNGTLCMIIANDYSVKGGSYYPITVKKHLRGQQIAIDNMLPVIYLVDSAGANLLLQADLFPDQHHFGKIFYNQSRMSALKIPQLAVVLGNCTAGGAYIPCMCDETIIVRKNGTVFLGGPALVAAATGEVVDAQELGGADVHCRVSGVTDYLAEDEDDALRLAREVSKRWKYDTSTSQEPVALTKSASARSPNYSASRIYGILPDMRTAVVKPFDVREILACLLDASEFTEFKALYDKNLVCGFGCIHGIEVGVIANNGVLLSESALKGTHFIQLCCSRKRPILFVQNITGFMIGKKHEREGIAKHGAKMVHAVSNAAVPKITLIIGGSYGAGNYAMCGRAYEPRFLFSWPGSRTAVMSGNHAGDVMCQIKRPSDESTFKAKIVKKYNEESNCYFSSARLWDDGLIDPRDTRDVLALAFRACLNAPIENTNQGIFRM